MLADRQPVALVDEHWAYEPKYDGMRAELAIVPGAGARLWSRDGNDKTAQFPDIVAAARNLTGRCGSRIVLDGEIVAADAAGRLLGFPPLSSRIPLTNLGDIRAASRRQPAVYIAFDILNVDGADLRPLTLSERRVRLQRALAQCPGHDLELAEHTRADGRALQQRAATEPGWEGVIAKRLDSVYRSGRRSPAWRKIKLRLTQSCLVGGWTEHRGASARSLLLGVYDAGVLRYIGHAVVALRRVDQPLWKRLASLVTTDSPFVDPPATTRTPPHWVAPQVVVEIQHDGWVGGKLRHPASFLGVREDVHVPTVHRETPETSVPSHVSLWAPPPSGPRVPRLGQGPLADVVGQLQEIEARGGAGVVTVPDGFQLPVSGLDRAVWPRLAITKGALLRYYTRMAPLILPTLADRPLGAKYYPRGLRGPGFFQQRAPADVPPGVRVELLDIDIPVRRRIIGGPLLTLLFMVERGVISQDPWFARLGRLDHPDHAVLDLDPMKGAHFADARDVALALREALERLSVSAFPKLSGASGIHLYIPLAAGTPYTEARTLCEAVAGFVVTRHPTLATTERTVARRGPKVYIDCLQNLRGKTLATAYSARANGFAGVSAPVTWDELAEGIRPGDVMVPTIEQRLRQVGDLWAAFRSAPGVAPRAVAGVARR